MKFKLTTKEPFEFSNPDVGSGPAAVVLYAACCRTHRPLFRLRSLFGVTVDAQYGFEIDVHILGFGVAFTVERDTFWRMTYVAPSLYGPFFEATVGVAHVTCYEESPS